MITEEHTRKKSTPAILTVMRWNKEIMFERRFESAFVAMNEARKFYNKTDAALIRIDLLDRTFFEYAPPRSNTCGL